MVNFADSLDDDATLFAVVNNLRTRLTAPISDTDTTIPVITTSGFPDSGYFTILSSSDITKAEAIQYDTFSATQFTGVTRGADGTIAANHLPNDNVDFNVLAAHHNALKDATIELERYVGVSGSENFVPRNSVTGDVTIDGDFTAEGASELNNAVVIGGGLTVSGSSTLGAISVSGTSSLAGDVDMKSTLTVSGVAAFGQPPVDESSAAVGIFDDTPATTSSATFTTVLTSAPLETGTHLLFYRGNIGLDSSSASTGVVEIQARLAAAVIGFGGGDNIEKLGHQQSAEIAGFKVVSLPGGTVDIQVRSPGASTTAEYGALGLMSIPLGAKGLVEDTDYWFDNGSDTEILLATGDNGIVTRNTFNFTVPEGGEYLILLSLEARGTREARVRFRLDGSVMVALQEIGNDNPSPFPAAVIRTLTAGSHTLLHQQGHDNTSSATSSWNRMRFFVLKTSVFDKIQDTEDSTPVVTAGSSFTHLSALQQTFVPLVQQQVALLGIGGYNTVNTSTNVTAASYKLVNSTDAEDYSLDSGMQIYNQGSGASNHATLMFGLLDNVASSKTFQMHFRNSSGDAAGVEHNEGSLIAWGLAAPVIVADIPLTTVDGNDITTHSINSDLANIRNMTVAEDITISGALTGSLLTAASGIFSDSLTISGVAVPINISTFDPNADETISGDWNFSSSLTVSGIPVSTGTGGGVSDHGALTGLDENDHPQYGQLADTESASGVWDFSTGLTVSGIPVDISGSTADHSVLNNLDFASSGHTGFASGADTSALAASGVVTDANVTTNAADIAVLTTSGLAQDAELLTVSGHLQTQIDAVEASDVGAITVSGGSDITGTIDFVGSNGVNVSAAGNTITFDGQGVPGGGGGGGGSSTLQEAYDTGDGTISSTSSKPVQTGDLTTTGTLDLRGDSTLTDLALSFSDDSNTGIFSSTDGRLSFVINGSETLRMDTTGGQRNLLILSAGNATSPALQFNDADTGFFRAVTDTLSLAVGGEEIVRWIQQDAASNFMNVKDKVGINFSDITTEPDESLHVVGSGIFTGDLNVQGDLTSPTGTFSDSLTVSGLPVTINASVFNADADETITGDWDFSNSLTVSGVPVATGSGEFIIHHVFPDATSTSITFSDIPQTARVISIDHSVRIDLLTDDLIGMLLQFNGDTGSNYARMQYLLTDDDSLTDSSPGVTHTSNSVQYVGSTTVLIIGQVPGNSAVANSFGAGHYTIPNYTNTTAWKSITGTAMAFSDDGNADGLKARISTGGGTWKDTSAITSIRIFHSSGRNFDTGSSITIRGY